MKLTDNPFALLGASTRDDRRRLLELSESFGLAGDPIVASRLRSELTNPQQRLKAEVAWLPGLSVSKADELLLAAGNPAGPPENWLRGVGPVAAANLQATSLATRLEAGPGTMSPSVLGASLATLARTHASIDAADTFRKVNEDRAVGGFPAVTDLGQLESALEERERALTSLILGALRLVDPEAGLEALHAAVQEATTSGTEHGPPLIHHLVDRYSIDLHSRLEEHASRVRSEIAVLRVMLKGGLDESAILRQTDWLEAAVTSYDRIAQPLQVSAQGRGIDHEHSGAVAADIRSLALEMHSTRGLTSVSQRLTLITKQAFEELVRVAAQADQDLEHIEVALDHQAKSELATREWEERIHFSGTYGMFSQYNLSVSSRGIQRNGTLIPLSAVSAVRWGGIRHSVNGIPTGTTYRVHVSGGGSAIDIDCRREAVYAGFVNALRNAVMFQLVRQLANLLRAGHAEQFGSAIVRDHVVQLTRTRILRSDEVRSFKWSETTWMSSEGHLIIQARNVDGYAAALPYLECDNVHVLEVLLRMLMTEGGATLSGALAKVTNE